MATPLFKKSGKSQRRRRCFIVQTVTTFEEIDVEILFSGTKATEFELLLCSVTGKSAKFHLAVVYRTPPCNANGFTVNKFFDEWDSFLQQLVILKNEIIITGDLNFHLDDPSLFITRKMLESFQSFNLLQHIKSQTHVKGHVLDVLITWQDTKLINSEPVVTETSITDSVSGCSLDHFALLVILSFQISSLPTK